MNFEFLIPKRPVSLQTKNRANLQAWKSFVAVEAAKTWTGTLNTGIDTQLTLVYLCNEDPVDTDNIIKPIQDALVGLIYKDDPLVTDVDCHRRPLKGITDITHWPGLLIDAIASGNECVYVRISNAKPLENYL